MYLTPELLLAKITEIFDKGRIMVSSAPYVVSIFKKWVQKYWLADIQLDKMESKLEQFWQSKLSKMIKTGQKNDSDFDLMFLIRLMAQHENDKDSPRKSRLFSTNSRRSVAIKKMPSTAGDQNEENPWNFLRLSKELEEISSILACIELKLYQTIRPEEFLEKLIWKGAEGEVNPKTKNLFALIDWMNQLGYWLATEICLCYDLKTRIKILTRFIEIAKENARLRCFNSVFAIVSGLSNSSIARLKQTWSGLSKKIQTDFEELEVQCSPQFNYKLYRKIESEATPPFIPFIGMHMRDMFFMNDGNPNKFRNGLQNFEKLRTLSKSIESVLAFQNKTFIPFPIKEDKLQEYINHINSVEPLQDRHLHKMSCQCEPPEWRKRTNFNRRNDDLNLL